MVKLIEPYITMTGSEFKEYRDSLDLTQGEAAIIMGADQSTVSRWEVKDTVPVYAAVILIALSRSEKFYSFILQKARLD